MSVFIKWLITVCDNMFSYLKFQIWSKGSFDKIYQQNKSLLPWLWESFSYESNSFFTLTHNGS